MFPMRTGLFFLLYARYAGEYRAMMRL
jgi:hypothetical protein